VRRWIGIPSVLGSALSQGTAIFTATCREFSWCIKANIAIVGLLWHRTMSLPVTAHLQRLALRESKKKRQYDL
jgi:hypothetical protein